jgi:hypothetical protein
MENKNYRINIINKDKSINILKDFFSKYEFKREIMLSALKDGASADDNQLYERKDELFKSCSIHYKFDDNKLIIEVYNHISNMPVDEQYIKLIDNVVIDIKKANGYKEEDLPAKHDVSDFDKHEKQKKFIKKYEEIATLPWGISLIATPILFIVMLLKKFENMTVNVLFVVCLIFFVGHIIFTNKYKTKNNLW